MEGSVSEKIAKKVVSLTYEDIPKTQITLAKHVILDSLGISLWGSRAELAEPAKILQKSFKMMGPTNKTATVWTTGIRTSPPYATMINGAMLRRPEFFDNYFGKVVIHPSENTPPAIAVAEHVHASGRDLLTSFVIGYELHCRLGDIVHPPSKGFHHTTTGLFVVPVIAGKLLGLAEEELVNAIGLSACFGFTLEEVHYGALSMARTIAYPLAAQHGIMCAFLAQNGFTGQRMIFEGDAGVMRQFSVTLSDLEHLTKIGENWQMRPEKTHLRKIASNNVSQSPVTATLECVVENDIKADDIKSVKALITQHSMRTAAAPARRHPRTKESADHSTYYEIAVAIVDRDVGPAQFTNKKINDPQIHDLIDKITIEVDPALPKDDFPFPNPTRWPATVIIETTDGKKYRKSIEKPKGHFGNLLTEKELVEKFRKMNTYSGVFDEDRADKIVEAVLNLENLQDVNELTNMLRTKRMNL